MTDLDMLRTADAEEARAFLADVDPVALVRAIAATGDDDLAALFGRPEVRGVAVSVLLDRLDEFALQDRLEAVRGVVRFDLEQDGSLAETRAVAFTGGALAEAPAGAPADVAIRTSILCFVRLVSGERNAGLEYLSGALDIDGDAALALAVGGVFRVPGTDAVAVDPSRLGAVAGVLRGQLKVKGDKAKALRLSSLIDFPQPR